MDIRFFLILQYTEKCPTSRDVYFITILFILQNKSEALIVACVSYLRQQMAMDAELFQLSELKEYLVILTNKGLKQPTKDNIYVTKEYGNEAALHENFPGTILFL